MKKNLVIVMCAALMPLCASADQLRPGGKSGHVTSIGSGVKEIGLDNVFILKMRDETTKGANGASDTTVSILEAAFVGGPTFRYFLMTNLALAVNANFTARHRSSETTTGSLSTDSAETELGAMGSVMVDYFVPLGFGMFLKPGIGGGGFYARSSTPIAGVPKRPHRQESVWGGRARPDRARQIHLE